MHFYCHCFKCRSQRKWINIINAFKDYQISSYARAVILNPMHHALPKIPCLIMPTTCNRFLHWYKRILTASILYEFLAPIIGPLVGYASDGDSRWQKLFLENGNNQTVTKYQPTLAKLGVVYSPDKVMSPNSHKFSLKDMADADYIHNHKNMINLLSHVSCIIMFGPYHVHMNTLVKVSNTTS